MARCLGAAPRADQALCYCAAIEFCVGIIVYFTCSCDGTTSILSYKYRRESIAGAPGARRVSNVMQPIAAIGRIYWYMGFTAFWSALQSSIKTSGSHDRATPLPLLAALMPQPIPNSRMKNIATTPTTLPPERPEDSRYKANITSVT